MFVKILITLLAFAALPTFGHAGHDHSHPLATLVHLLWLAPLMLAVGFLIMRFCCREIVDTKERGEK